MDKKPYDVIGSDGGAPPSRFDFLMLVVLLVSFGLSVAYAILQLWRMETNDTWKQSRPQPREVSKSPENRSHRFMSDDNQNRCELCGEINERVSRAQIIINEAVRQVHELGCGLVADGTIEGNGIWFDTLRAQDRQAEAS